MRPPLDSVPLPLDQPAADLKRSGRLPVLPPLLLILALLDLRTDLLLLFDHVTITTALNAITAHPLAVLVLVAQPSLWRRYSASRR